VAPGAAPADQIADRAKSQDHHRPGLRLGHRRHGDVQWPTPATRGPVKERAAAAERSRRTSGRTRRRRRAVLGHFKRTIWRVGRAEGVIAAGFRGFFAGSCRQITAARTGTTTNTNTTTAAAADATGAAASSAATATGTSAKAKAKAETVTTAGAAGAWRGIKEGKTALAAALATSRARALTGARTVARTRPAASKRGLTRVEAGILCLWQDQIPRIEGRQGACLSRARTGARAVRAATAALAACAAGTGLSRATAT
jgi:hypothetical protein